MFWNSPLRLWLQCSWSFSSKNDLESEKNLKYLLLISWLFPQHLAFKNVGSLLPVVKSHDACKSNSYQVGFKLHLAYVNFTFVSFYCATNMKGTLGDFFYYISNFIYGSLLFAARFVENTFHKYIKTFLIVQTIDLIKKYWVKFQNFKIKNDFLVFLLPKT